MSPTNGVKTFIKTITIVYSEVNEDHVVVSMTKKGKFSEAKNSCNTLWHSTQSDREKIKVIPGEGSGVR